MKDEIAPIILWTDSVSVSVDHPPSYQLTIHLRLVNISTNHASPSPPPLSPKILMGESFDHHARTLYQLLKRGGAVSLKLWTDADGGEHAIFSRPPPLQRRSPVPLFPEGLPKRMKRRLAPTDRARDMRRRRSPPCLSNPASWPPGTKFAAPGPSVAHLPLLAPQEPLAQGEILLTPPVPSV